MKQWRHNSEGGSNKKEHEGIKTITIVVTRLPKLGKIKKRHRAHAILGSQKGEEPKKAT